MDHFISQYFGMNVAHLHDEELSHELQIRRIEEHGEARSVLERKCRAELKREGSGKCSEIEYEKTWETIVEELEVCDKQVQEIKQVLDARLHRKAPDQHHKSRLLHYLFRLLRAKAHTTDESELNSISELAGECVRLLNTFYSIASPYPEIRRAEIDIVNDSLRKVRYAFPEEITRTPTAGQPTNLETGDVGDAIVQEGFLAGTEENDEGKHEEAVGGEPENEIEILRIENSQLKSMLDQLLTRMESLETQLPNANKSHQQSKNSTKVGEPEDSEDPEDCELVNVAKPKFSYREFMDWLVQDQNLLQGVPRSDERNSQSPRNVVLTRQPTNAGVTSSRGNPVQDCSGNRLAIHKWKIHYDGADNGRRLIEFLREVEFTARSEGFSKQELYNSAYHLLIGKARSWYMEVNAQNELLTWDNLVSELKREFLPPDIDYQHERQAHLRKQGTRERFQDYYLEMTRIFRNMTVPLDEAKKFQILFRNLRSEYKSAMLAANINTIARMREFGKNFDSINWQWYTRSEKDSSSRGYRSTERQVNEIGEGKKPSSNTNRQWKSETFRREFTNSNRPQNYKNPPIQNPKPSQQSSNPKTPEPKQGQPIKPDNQKPGPSKSFNPMERILKAYVPLKRGTCFNCHNFGHNSTQCSQEKQVFCDVCGFPGFVQKDCPFCASKNTDKTAQ